jgi:glycosyltransferase involved in cell wall biosynthesis
LNSEGSNGFQVFLTINGSENKYSKYIYNRYKNVRSLKFIGQQSRESVYQYYDKVDCLIFPSKLETWGMPITEFKSFNKPILLADMKYAHETIGEYEKVTFFDPDNHNMLAELMKKLMENTATYQNTKKVTIKQPFANSWKELFDIILK